MGNGFLFDHETSYARVQWQYGIGASVPQNAEGVGEVILRDFGRLLAGRTKIDAAPPQFEAGAYRTLILAGISQSGFFINTFLAEGFNADPATGRAVFDGAIAVDGTGNWLALNQLAAENDSNEYPYLVANGKPLAPSVLLKRPQSDPYYVDIANYTDFYRLRASLTDGDVTRPAGCADTTGPARTQGRRQPRRGARNVSADAMAACPRIRIPFLMRHTCGP